MHAELEQRDAHIQSIQVLTDRHPAGRAGHFAVSTSFVGMLL